MKSKRTIALPAGVARHFKNGDKIKLSMPFIHYRQESGSINYHPNFALSYRLKLDARQIKGSVNFELKDYCDVIGNLCKGGFKYETGEVEAVVVSSSDKKSEMSFIITDSQIIK